LKTLEQLALEHDAAQKVVLDKAIEITLFNMGIDPEKVSAKDFDQVRRLTMEMDNINTKADEKTTKIREEADIEIEGIVNQLDVLTIEIKEKQVPEEAPASS
jgi:hypothetical protein